jgi:hypothetical protein
MEVDENEALGHPLSSIRQCPAKVKLKVMGPHQTPFNGREIHALIGFFEMLPDPRL